MDEELKELKTLYNSLTTGSETAVKCAYCGARATDREHVVPRSFFGDHRKNIRLYGKLGNIVMSCRECNLMAGAIAFRNFYEKKEYILGRLEKRYRKIIKSEDWELEEIDALQGRVKEYVYFCEMFKKQLSARLENLRTPEIII